MKTFEIRSLLQGKEKIIDIPVEIVQAYKNWRAKRNNDDVISPEEVFYAGYIMSNPIVRQQYQQEKKIINKKEY
ncbi:hypothetical protein [Methanobrevibacter sp.]|uniref:hypothetical protein n=1 Tax=Methanobrevibacter sp. TaxID=66852 RepID=UPI003868F9CF